MMHNLKLKLTKHKNKYNRYPAKVVSVSTDGLLYTINYTDYDDNEIVRASSLRKISAERTEEIKKVNRKREAQEAFDTALDEKNKEEKDLKKKKNREKKEKLQKKNEEQNKKQEAWLKFTTKVKPGKSIFSSPDTIDGKVGVIGSGKGVTDYHQRKKHEFQKDD